MESTVSKKKTIISYIISFAFIIAMITASVILKDHEFILPSSSHGDCHVGMAR